MTINPRILSWWLKIDLGSSLSLHLLFHNLDLLQHLLVGQQAFSHQYPPCGILLQHHLTEQFLEGDDLLGIKVLGHAQIPPS